MNIIHGTGNKRAIIVFLGCWWLHKQCFLIEANGFCHCLQLYIFKMTKKPLCYTVTVTQSTQLESQILSGHTEVLCTWYWLFCLFSFSRFKGTANDHQLGPGSLFWKRAESEGEEMARDEGPGSVKLQQDMKLKYVLKWLETQFGDTSFQMWDFQG